MARSVVIRSCFKKPLLLKLKGLRRASTNPFINFYLVYMENMYGCRCKVKGVSREAAKVWARMSHVEREPFIVMARQKRQRAKCCSKRSGRARGKRSRKRSSRRRCKPRGRSRRGSRRRKRSRRSRCRSRSRRRSGRSRSRSGRRGRSRSGRRGGKSLRRWCTAKPPCVGGSASRKRSRSRRSCSKRSRRRSRKRPRRRSRKCGSRRRRSRSRRRRSGSRRRCSKRSTSQGSWCTVQPTCKRTKTPPPGSGDPEDQ